MAHKGKVWPLAFRRDFNLNVNTNQGGLPKTWHIGWGQWFLTPGFFLDNKSFFCDESPMPAADTLEWQSVLTPIGFYLFRCRVQGKISGSPSGMTWTVILDASPIGNALTMRFGVVESQQSMPRPSVDNELIFYNPLIFFIRPINWVPSTFSPSPY